MNPTELMAQIGDSYLWLNIPDIEDSECREKVESIFRLVAFVEAAAIEQLLVFPDWRERMVGHLLAVRMGPRRFASAMVNSLAVPHGLAIVPTCAALVLALAEENSDEWLPKFAALDRSQFDGDVGWSLDKMMFHLGWSRTNPRGHSPDDGKDFCAHLSMFRWVTDS